MAPSMGMYLCAQACLHFVDSVYKWVIQGLTIVTEYVLCLEKVN